MKVTILNGGTVSSVADVSNSGHLLGFVMPAAFTGATVGFQVSADGTTYATLYNSSNNAVSITVTQGRAYSFTADILSALSNWRYVKLVSGSAEGADRDIQIWVR